MPNLHSIEDDAVRYVLGELTPAEQRAFEAQLDQSVSLRKWVKALESGVEAITLSVFPKRPPASIWQEIEKTTIRKRRARGEWFLNWIPWFTSWRGGWAVATACACGWLLYALWRPTTDPVAPSVTDLSRPVAAQKDSPQVTVSTITVNPFVNSSNNPALLLQARTRQLETLQRRNTELERRLARVSLIVAEQQVLLSESNRLRFFRLDPVTAENDGTGYQSLSPRLQWALYMALAHELGWQLPNGSPFTGTNEFNSHVAFVDLRPTNNTATATSSMQSQDALQTELALREANSSPALTNNAIAGFISGTTAVVALDPTAAPPDSVFTFWTTGDNGQYQSVGSGTLADNPTVVLVPTSAGLGTSLGPVGNGSYLTITATSPSGAVTDFGQVFLPIIPNSPSHPP